jgi:hypothetical protein
MPALAAITVAHCCSQLQAACASDSEQEGESVQAAAASALPAAMPGPCPTSSLPFAVAATGSGTLPGTGIDLFEPVMAFHFKGPQ